MRFTNITAFAAAFCLALPIAAFAQGAEEGDVELPNKIAKKKDQTL